MSFLQQLIIIISALVAGFLTAFGFGIKHQKNKENENTIDEIAKTQKRAGKRSKVSYADKLEWLHKYDQDKH